MVDILNTILKELNQIPGPIFPSILSFIFGYWFGGIFTAAKNREIWGAIWRIFALYVLATSGLIDDIMRHRIPEICFVAGIIFAARPFITSFWNWTVDLVSAVFSVGWQIIAGAYRAVEAVAILLARIVSFGKSIPKIAPMGWRQSGAAFKEAKQEKPHRESREGKSSSQDEVKREQDRRAEEMRREYARRAESKGEKPNPGQQREQPQEPPRREPPPPPPTKEPPDPTKDVDAAIRYFELDKHLFTYEDLRQAHKKKVLALHPDKLQSFPDHIRRQLDDELKTINAARDLIKKWKGWK